MPIPPSEAGPAGAGSGQCPIGSRLPRPRRENPVGVRIAASRVRLSVRPASAPTEALPATAAYAPPRMGRGAPTRGNVQKRVHQSQPVLAIARPPVVPRVGDHTGADGVGLDVLQHDQQVVIVLDRRALEPALPHVPRGAVPLVVSPGVGHAERLGGIIGVSSFFGPL